MKSIVAGIFSVIFLFASHTTGHTSSVSQELYRVAEEVAALKLGFPPYILGEKLTEEQKTEGMKHAIPKSLNGTYKFKDGEVFVIAAEDNDIVLGMYKEFENFDPEQLKNIVGSLMFQYGEPTAVAHENMIYWTYNSKGKISQDTFEFERSNGGAQSLVTIKFSSSDKIGKPSKETLENAEPYAYLMVTSDKMSTLFLAHTQTTEK